MSLLQAAQFPVTPNNLEIQKEIYSWRCLTEKKTTLSFSYRSSPPPSSCLGFDWLPAHLPLERLVFGGSSLPNLQYKGIVFFARESFMKQWQTNIAPIVMLFFSAGYTDLSW